MIKIVIDGKDYVAEEGLSLLKVLRANGKAIPSLCYHPALAKAHWRLQALRRSDSGKG